MSKFFLETEYIFFFLKQIWVQIILDWTKNYLYVIMSFDFWPKTKMFWSSPKFRTCNFEKLNSKSFWTSPKFYKPDQKKMLVMGQKNEMQNWKIMFGPVQNYTNQTKKMLWSPCHRSHILDAGSPPLTRFSNNMVFLNWKSALCSKIALFWVKFLWNFVGFVNF